MALGRLTVTTRSMLAGWTALAATLAALNYLGNALSEREDGPSDLLFEWATAVAGLIQYGVIAVIVLAIGRSLAPSVLGLVPPASWPRALGLVAASLLAILVAGAILNQFLKAGDEQGLLPDGWDSSRAAPFIANAVVVAVVAPVVEELTYRGLGYAVVRDAAGPAAAIIVTGIAFGLAHGLVIALPILSLFGFLLGYVRYRTGSVYPCIVLHGVFNGLQLLAAVTVGSG